MNRLDDGRTRLSKSWAASRKIAGEWVRSKWFIFGRRTARSMRCASQVRVLGCDKTRNKRAYVIFVEANAAEIVLFDNKREYKGRGGGV